MLKIRVTPWWCAFALSAAPPAAITAISLSIVLFLFLGDTEFDAFGRGGGAEQALRFLGIVVVVLLSIVVAATLLLPIAHRGSRRHVIRHAEGTLSALTLGALAAFGTAFSILDVTFSIGESPSAVVTARLLGWRRSAPC